MKNVIRTCLSALCAGALLLSCTKQDPVTPKPKPDPGSLADFYPASVYKWGLKDLARACDLLIGAEFTYGEYGQDDSLKVVLKRDFDATVFGNEMKHDCDVYGWDVVNEVLTDAGTWRTQNDVQDGYHVFLWGQYYPGGTKEFVDQAFRNAREALEREGKTADLYINDYNLEWSQAKVEALCKYAEGNPDVTGVGSQMHISSDVNRDNVRSMLERMVRTGKKVRISELDVSLGNTNQGETIVYIFDQYLKIVPKEQRGGITFWGVSDKNSWLGADKQPLLYSKAYLRKDSYLKLHAYLLERSGLQ